MTKQQLTEIEVRCNAATPPPWYNADNESVRSDNYDVAYLTYDDEGRIDPNIIALYEKNTKRRVYDLDVEQWPFVVQDAEFIAHSREDLPACVAEIRRLRAALQTIVMPPWAADPVRVAIDALDGGGGD
jgi:hypothetical protein